MLQSQEQGVPALKNHNQSTAHLQGAPRPARPGACCGVTVPRQLAELAHVLQQLTRLRDERAYHPAPAAHLPAVQVPEPASTHSGRHLQGQQARALLREGIREVQFLRKIFPSR